MYRLYGRLFHRVATQNQRMLRLSRVSRRPPTATLNLAVTHCIHPITGYFMNLWRPSFRAKIWKEYVALYSVKATLAHFDTIHTYGARSTATYYCCIYWSTLKYLLVSHSLLTPSFRTQTMVSRLIPTVLVATRLRSLVARGIWQ